MATIDERRGTIFAGRYRLERKLGSGGMADVWLAEDQELGRKVAIKMLHERYANDVQFVERFRREATHAAGLSHPNVVSIYDRGEAEGSYFIVMEYVEGRTLKELIVTRGPCPVPVAVSYTRQVLAALRYAHRNGIVHRDIKPHNVLVDHEGRVKVADFGIARAGSSQMTEAGSIIGTAQYLSPEQARGAPVDESSDLYSTGIVLYELLTGTVPFTGETPVEIAMKHLSQVPEAPSKIRPEIPATSTSSSSARWRRSRPSGTGPQRRWIATSSSSAGASPSAGDRGGRDDGPPRRDDRRDGGGAAPAALRATAATSGIARTRARSGAAAPGGRGCSRSAPRSRSASAPGSSTTTSRTSSTPNDPVIVDNYEGILEENAVHLIRADGFEPKVIRLPNGEVEPKYVFEQEPYAGDGTPEGEHRHDPGLDGQEEDRRAVPRGQVPRYRGGRTDERRPRRRRARGARPGKTSGWSTAQDPPRAACRRGRRLGSTSEGAEAGGHAERRRLKLDVTTARCSSPASRSARSRSSSDRPAGEVVDQTTAPELDRPRRWLASDALRLAAGRRP